MKRCYDPALHFDPEVRDYLAASLGQDRFRIAAQALTRPSLAPTLRVNTLRTTPEDVQARLTTELGLAEPPKRHPQLPYVLQLQGRGPDEIDYPSECGDAEVLINRRAAEAVLRGAHVYASGVLAASRGLAPGSRVIVSAALELPGRTWAGVNRGAVLRPGDVTTSPGRFRLCLGVGISVGGRRQMFAAHDGLVVTMERRVWDIPACNGGAIISVEGALPSIAAVAALGPQPGSRVLDMCASPGGKATLCAQLMQGTGQVVALDRTHAKVQRIRQLAADLGLRNVRAYKTDSTQVIQPGLHAGGVSTTSAHGAGEPSDASEDEEAFDSDSASDAGALRVGSGSDGGSHAPVTFPPESFDFVVLDVPCSALGLRPRLLHAAWTLPRLHALARYQRALIHAGVQALRPGGRLLLSTCTLNPGECEANVGWALDRYSGLHLVPPAALSGPALGGPGLVGCDPVTGEAWLRGAEEAHCVQRFDPGDVATGDTIGFFIACFEKRGSLAAA